MLSVSLLLLTLLSTQTISTVIHQPGLTFQVDGHDDLTGLVPPSSDEESPSSSEFGRSSAPPPSSYSDVRAPPFAFYPLNLPPFPPTPSPLALPFFSLFHSVLKSFPILGPSSEDLYPLQYAYHPHHDPLAKPIDCREFTIGQILNWTLHHTPKPESHHEHSPPLYRFAWLVNTSQAVQETLYDPHADLTLFAPDDEALAPPSKRKHHHHHPILDSYHSNSIDKASYGEDTHPFWDAIEAIRSDPHRHQSSDEHHPQDDEDEDPKKLKLVKFYLRVIEFVLKYHISPGSKTIAEIADRSTLATKLPVFPWSEQPSFRVRVGPGVIHRARPGEIRLNVFTILDTFKSRPILTKNGVIYIVEKFPLLQPLSPLSELFLFPRPFSTLTSAIQKVHLDEVLLPRWANKTIPISSDLESRPSSSGFSFGPRSAEDVDERVLTMLSSITGEDHANLSKASFTIFAPTNHAFRKLGPAANAFLFSPFGEHILRYVLSYHVVPNLIWHTDYCERTEQGKAYECNLNYTSSQGARFPPSGVPMTPGGFPGFPQPPITGKVNVTDLTLPTLLGSRQNESLPLSLIEFRHFGKGPIVRHLLIKQKYQNSVYDKPDKNSIPVVFADGVAWGGALHLIPSLIHPPVPEGHHQRRDVQRAIELSILSSV